VSYIVVAGGEETVRLIKAAGGEATFIKADVAKTAEVEALINKVVATYGRLDCALNNAGIEGAMTSTVDCSEENFDRTIAVNLKGVWLCMKHEIPQMLKQGGGAIVNTASVAGLVGFQGLSAYVASKHGVNGLTKTAALEYAKAGIRVNAVCPGVLHTPMLDRLFSSQPAAGENIAALEPVGRLGKPEEIAAAVQFSTAWVGAQVTGLGRVTTTGFQLLLKNRMPLGLAGLIIAGTLSLIFRPPAPSTISSTPSVSTASPLADPQMAVRQPNASDSTLTPQTVTPAAVTPPPVTPSAVTPPSRPSSTLNEQRPAVPQRAHATG
jgi:NAD(P)-dependent dehydrogenase (short-subunit alcohol dehydrogenase family)